MTDRRWPFAPLERHIAGDRALTAADIGPLFGVTGDTIKKWRQRGLSTDRADWFAIKVAGTHPCGVWDDWYEDVGCRPRLIPTPFCASSTKKTQGLTSSNPQPKERKVEM